MGNQLSAACSLQSIERLNLDPQQRENIDLYIWRASPQTNTYIPRVKLNPQQGLLLKKQTFICINQKDTVAPNLMFEDYLCDFRQLKSFLDVSQLLTVFKMVLKGHQTIFAKFNASIVSDKCSFLTPEGQIRVWINPNYYLNEFWSVQIERRQVRAKTQFIHNLNNHTPRFLNRQEFESKSVGLIMSQHILIRKIVHLMLNLARNSEESSKFQSFIENQINSIKINEIKFEKMQFLIDQYARMNKIMIRHNIEQVVKRLVSQGAVFHSEKCSLRSLKQTRKTMHVMQSRNNSTFIQNPTIGQQSNLNSILDVRTQPMSRMKNLHNLSKGNMDKSVTQKQHIETEETQNFSNIFQQKTFNQQKPQHKRKLSKSLIQPTIEYETNTVENYQQLPDKQLFRKKEIPYKNISQVKVQQDYSKKLGYSFQYSINLYTSQTKNHTQRSSQFKPQTERNHTYRQSSPQQISNLKESLNSKPSSILKKANTKSFEVGKSFNGFLNQDKLQNKKKILVFEEPLRFDHLSDVKNGKQLCISTFEADDYVNKTLQNTHIQKSKKYQYSDEIIDDLDETKKATIRNRQISSGNMWSVQQQRPFELITKQQIFMKQNEVQNKLLARTFLNPQARYSINNHKGQTSMLINIKNTDKQKKETLIRSKRRISVGGEAEAQGKTNGSTPHNFLGLESIQKNQYNQNHTSRTITRLMSSENILQTSVGSFSSFEESEADSQTSRYTGILTKMGRNVPYRRVSDDYVKEILENQKPNNQNMPNFSKKKKTLVEIGSNRSMKI